MIDQIRATEIAWEFAKATCWIVVVASVSLVAIGLVGAIVCWATDSKPRN